MSHHQMKIECKNMLLLRVIEYLIYYHRSTIENSLIYIYDLEEQSQNYRKFRDKWEYAETKDKRYVDHFKLFRLNRFLFTLGFAQLGTSLKNKRSFSCIFISIAKLGRLFHFVERLTHFTPGRPNLCIYSDCASIEPEVNMFHYILRGFQANYIF